MRNVTVDDNDSSALVYSPPLCDGTGWLVEEGKGYGGSYRWCSGAHNPAVTLTFRGNAVFYHTPVTRAHSVQLILDDGAAETVHLSSCNLSESSTVWARTGLSEGPHTLQILSGAGSPGLAVDSFTYTTTDDIYSMSPNTDEPESPSSLQRILLRRALPKDNTTTIIVCSIFGGLVLCILIWLAIFLRKKANQHASQFSWKVNVPPLDHSQDETGHANTSVLSRSRGEIQSADMDLDSSRQYYQQNAWNAPKNAEDIARSGTPASMGGYRSLPKPPSRSFSNHKRLDDFDESKMVASPASSYRVPPPTVFDDAPTTGSPRRGVTVPQPTAQSRPLPRSPSGHTYIPISKLEPIRRKPDPS